MRSDAIHVDHGRRLLSEAANGLIDDIGRILPHVPDEMVRAEIDAAVRNHANRIRALILTPMTMTIKEFCKDFPCSRCKAYSLMNRKHDPLPPHIIAKHRTIYLAELFLWLLRQPSGSIKTRSHARRPGAQTDRLKSIRTQIEAVTSPAPAPRADKRKK